MEHKHCCPERPVNLLWTGGWDSTFRLLELVLVLHRNVQPYYVLDIGRQSTLHELRAMKEIKARVVELQDDKEALICPAIIVARHDIEKDESITKKYQRLRRRGRLGSQYEWLARLVNKLDIGRMELCVHVDDRAYDFLEDTVEPIAHESNTRESWVVKSNTDNNDLALFDFFEFPLLQMTKIDMQMFAEEAGFIELLENSWFCHSPNGKNPCGICDPCKFTIEEGMGYRVPRVSLMRYRARAVYRFLRLSR